MWSSSCAPLLENGLVGLENSYDRYGFASFSCIFIPTVGVEGARRSLRRFSIFALWAVVVDTCQCPVCENL